MNLLIVLLSSLLPVIIEYIKSLQIDVTSALNGGGVATILLAFKNYRNC